MFKNPTLYEINTRVWIRKFGKTANNRYLKLDEIPREVWEGYASKGINAIWLMGVWKTADSAVKKYCFTDFLMRSYDKALKDWRDEDVIGSPYAIDQYVVNPELGDFDSLLRLKEMLNSMGIMLFLDFVSNHFSAETSLIYSSPEIFLQADEETYRRDSHTYFNPKGSSLYFAHGRDPFFPAWEDTVQVNYFSEAGIKYMTDTLVNIARCCDGVRCDMAMLALDNVFYNTWSGPLNRYGFSHPKENFWRQAIRKVKEQHPEFTFIAEAYWDLEWELQQLGFDYTYDKKLTDRLIAGSARDIKLHLLADPQYQSKSVRFIENHDEERAVTLMGKNKSMAAAVVISTIQGMRFFHNGQVDGKKIKLPVQLGRAPEEPVNSCMSSFYNKLFSITRCEVFRKGEWKLLDPLPSWEDNATFSNMLSWMWRYKDKNCIVVVNYSDSPAQCRLKFDISGYEDRFVLTDMLTGTEYIRPCEEVCYQGLYVDLKAYQSHIFFF
ncbi:MAG: alpha-amylase family glycosyl hydrolase [Bacteroidota bacterium]